MYIFGLVWNRVSLCNPGRPGARCVFQAGLSLTQRDQLVSASRWATPGTTRPCCTCFLNYEGLFMHVLWTPSSPCLIPSPPPLSPLSCPTVLFVPQKFSLSLSSTHTWLCIFGSLGPTLYLYFSDIPFKNVIWYKEIHTQIMITYPKINTQYTLFTINASSWTLAFKLTCWSFTLGRCLCVVHVTEPGIPARNCG